MRAILTVLCLAAVMLAGCQWATYREVYAPTPQQVTPSETRSVGEARQEHRRTERFIGYEKWTGDDGKTYVRPVYEIDDGPRPVEEAKP